MSYEDYLSNSSMYSDEEMLLALGIVGLVFAAIAFIAWLITLYPRYYMVKASRVGPVWTAFVPIVQDVQFFKMAGWPWWSYFAYLIGFPILAAIPVVNIFSSIGMFVFLCILHWRVAANFGLGTGGKILTLIFGYLVYWYVALARKPYMPVYGMYAQHQQYNSNQNWYQNNGQTSAQDNSWYQQPNQYAQPQQPQQTQQDWYQQNNNPPQQ